MHLHIAGFKHYPLTMQTHIDSTTPEPFPASRNRRWGCLVTLTILTLVALFLVWDLYSIWGAKARHRNLQEIAQPGKLWSEVEPVLLKEEYPLAPLDFVATPDEKASMKLVLVNGRTSILLNLLTAIAEQLQYLNYAAFISGFSPPQEAYIYLNDNGRVSNLATARI